jgi:integrase
MFARICEHRLDSNWTQNMARSIRNNTLETRTARLKLPITSKPVFAKVGDGVGLGYRRNKLAGNWVARLSDGQGGYATKVIGTDDDYEEAAPPRVLDFWQATEAARRFARNGDAAAEEKPKIVSVDNALTDYTEHLATERRDRYNVSRVRRHLPPALLKRPIALLTSVELERWRNDLAKRITPASVNCSCAALKAALNRTAKHDRTLDRHAWTVGLAKIGGADNSNNVILPERVVAAIVAEARKISVEFGNLVQTMAETGARFSQLARCEISDLFEGRGAASQRAGISQGPRHQESPIAPCTGQRGPQRPATAGGR